MGLAALEKRIRALEAASRAIGKPCRCRAGRQTRYHTAEELKQMMDAGCAVHGFRELGNLIWVGSGLPLRLEDQHLCSCPPCPVREFLRGRRGPLTEVEQQEEEQRWEREYATAADEEFRREQTRVQRLLQQYKFKKLQRRRN
jgi:hypothetical protein